MPIINHFPDFCKGIGFGERAAGSRERETRAECREPRAKSQEPRAGRVFDKISDKMIRDKSHGGRNGKAKAIQ